MLNILLTGVATLDIINYLSAYPAEDSEVRVLSQQLRTGGNAANSAIVLQQLGIQAHLLAQRADDQNAEWLFNQLKQRHIDVSLCPVQANSHTPTSYISVSQETGSRSIVHYRQLDELNDRVLTQLDLRQYDWLHFEARHCTALKKMLIHSQKFNRPISIELEKTRPSIDSIIPYADILLVSRAYAESLHFTTALECLQALSTEYADKIISCTWGDQGAWLYYNQSIIHQPAYNQQQIIDTLAAGDTYNAAFISSLAGICQNKNELSLLPYQALQQSLDFACQIAARKCSQSGLDKLKLN